MAQLVRVPDRYASFDACPTNRVIYRLRRVDVAWFALWILPAAVPLARLDGRFSCSSFRFFDKTVLVSGTENDGIGIGFKVSTQGELRLWAECDSSGVPVVQRLVVLQLV